MVLGIDGAPEVALVHAVRDPCLSLLAIDIPAQVAQEVNRIWRSPVAMNRCQVLFVEPSSCWEIHLVLLGVDLYDQYTQLDVSVLA